MAKKPKKLTEKQALEALSEVRTFGPEPDESLAKAALDIVNSYYWRSVREHAADFLKRANDGDFKDDEGLEDALREDVDKNYWVIYTYWARVCILCSNNADAWEEEMGSKPEGVEQQAYGALMQDIRNHPDYQEAEGIARGDDE